VAKLDEMQLAQLNDDQLQKLKEVEKFINASRSHDIYLLAFRKNNSN